MSRFSTPSFGSADAPLVTLARTGALPRHQYMDLHTLAWIAAHRPSGPPTARLSLAPELTRYAFVPAAWFMRPQTADSIHGQRHGARVALLAGLLARHERLSPRETLEAVLAGALHDCRRLHDRADSGHGARAGDWLSHHVPVVSAHFRLDPAEIRESVISTAMALHDIAYAAFTTADQTRYATAARVCDVVKTADALDRYRLPKLAWWPDPGFLRLIPPAWTHRFAFDLMLASERCRLDGMGNEEAVSTALTIAQGGHR